MRKNHITLFLALISLAFLITSCKDDPYILVKPPQPPTPTDTADWYTWRAIEVGGYLFDMYVADSNNIYITSGGALFYNGQTFQYINLQDPDFRVLRIRGYDKNNVFFWGWVRHS
jgi:hypothetical protein